MQFHVVRQGLPVQNTIGQTCLPDGVRVRVPQEYFIRLPNEIIKKGKVQPLTGYEGTQGEYRYNSTLSLISELKESGCSTTRSDSFTPG
jgi:hypothetical protein